MLQFKIDEERCSRCGQCAWDCVSGIIETDDGGLPFIREEKEKLCLQCQHCLALCPTGALSILGRNPDDSAPLSPERLPTLDQMMLLVRGRRSVRHYQDKNVDPALLRKLLAALANAPTGVNRRELTFTVIHDRDLMRQFKAKVLTGIGAAAAGGRLKQASYLEGAVRADTSEGKDVIFRGAPHALIVSAPAAAPCAQEDVALALAYFELLAQCAGLGTVWWGMFKSVVEALPELKLLLGIQPTDAYYAMLFGIPAIEFARTVQRDDGAAIRMLAL